MGQITGVFFPVMDAEKMARFFCEGLSCEKVAETHLREKECRERYQLPHNEARLVTLRLGKEHIYLFETLLSKGKPYPLDLRSNDLAFQHIALVVSDMQQAYQKLQKWGVQAISEAPQTIPASNAAAAGIQAFYFRSPEGHPLELIFFPPGKGPARWQTQRGLFLGIDHTAITVSDTEKSLAFYRDTLRLQVAGSSLNQGPTQEKLSGVPGAKVKITCLRYEEASMGLEFLHYLHPQDGRPSPGDLQANDLLNVRTVFARVEMRDPDQHPLLLCRQEDVCL